MEFEWVKWCSIPLAATMLAVRTAWGFSLSYLILALIGELQCLGPVHTLKAALPALGAAALVDMISAAYSKNMRRARDGLNKKQARRYACYVVLTLVDDINFRNLQRASASGKRCLGMRLRCAGELLRHVAATRRELQSSAIPSHRCSLDHNTHTTSTI
jgi:hypothetical protein